MAVNRYYSSTAQATTLNGAINSSVTSIVVNAVTGFPTSYPYTLILDRDTVNEEVVKVTAAAGTTLTVVRAQDGTSGLSHANGATVEHGVSAQDFTEPQAHIAATAAHGAAVAVVGTTEVQTLTNKTLASPAFTGTATGLSASGASLDAVSTVNGVTGAQISGDHAAWTSYTPTFGNCSSPTGDFAYKQVGKTLFLRWDFTGGTATASAAITFTLPGGLTAFVRYALPTYPSNSTVTPFPTFVIAAASGTLTSPALTAGQSLISWAGRGTAVIEVA